MSRKQYWTACVCHVAIFLLLASELPADDWPQFRGPNRDGKSTETGLLKKWPDSGPRKLSTVSGLGDGYSSPAVVGGKIFITGLVPVPADPKDGAQAGQTNRREMVFCFDSSGKKLWETPVGGGPAVPARRASHSTPTVSGNRVYLRSIDGAVLALDAATGQIAWNVDVIKEFSGTQRPLSSHIPENVQRLPRGMKDTESFFGGQIPTYVADDSVSESALVDGKLVICTPGGPDACIVALDKETGKTVWTSKGLGDGVSCSSPIAFEFGGVRQVAQVTDKALVGVRISDGKLLWRYEVKADVACPVFSDGIIYVGRGVAVKLAAKGDSIMAEKHFALPTHGGWGQGGFPVCNALGAGCVVVDGCLYGGSSDYDRGRDCIELATGREKFHVLEATMCGRAIGPVIYADGMLYYQSEFGAVRMGPASSRKAEVAGTFYFPFLEGRTTAHPAIADGKLYIRNLDRLFVYDIKTEPAAVKETAQPASTTAAGKVTTTDWPQFRGPNRDGKSSETGLLKSWPQGGPPLLQTIDVGLGPGSPSIAGGRIYIGGSTDKKGFVRCFDLEGNKIWEAPIGGVATFNFNGPASTPTIEGDRLYFLTDSGNVLALETATGKEVWHVELVKQFKGRVAAWGFTSSVLVDGDNLICAAGGPDASLVALDKKTGNTVWTTKGVSDSAGNGSPIAFDFAGRRLVAAITSRSLICVDAKDGNCFWRYDRPSVANFASTHCEALGGHDVSSPIFYDGILAGFNIHTSGGAVRLGLDGNKVVAQQIWDTHALWPKTSGFIEVDGYLYSCSLPGGGASFVCVNARTGRTMYSKPDINVGGPIIYADDRFYCTSFRSGGGIALVERSTEGFKKAGVIPFPETFSYPALSAGRFYVRSLNAERNAKLYVYDVRDRHGAMLRALRERHGVAMEADALRSAVAEPNAAIVAGLLSAIRDNEEVVRLAALDALTSAYVKDAEALKTLAKSLADPELCLAVAATLIKNDPQNERIVPAITEHLKKAPQSERKTALEYLAKLAASNSAARVELGRVLKGAAMRNDAAEAALKYDRANPELPAVLSDILKNEDEQTRARIIEQVGATAVDSSLLVPVAVSALKDPAAANRRRAAEALIHLAPKDKKTVLLLGEAYASEKDEHPVKSAIWAGLERIGKRPFLEISFVRATPKSIELRSNTPLDRDSAGNPASYDTGGIKIGAAEIANDGLSVRLATAEPIRKWGDQMTFRFPGVKSVDGLPAGNEVQLLLLPGIPVTEGSLAECLVGETRSDVKPMEALRKAVLDEARVRPAATGGWKYFAANWGRFDLGAIARDAKASVIHAHFYVYSDRDRTVQAWLGSHNGLRAVVNGNVVHVIAELRPVAEDQDKIEKVALKKGWNTILLMLPCLNDQCGFLLRLKDENGGKPGPGMSYSAECYPEGG